MQVRLRLSPHGQLLSLTLDAAIKGLCQAMVVADNKCTVETLTSRSIGGIVPISGLFNAHWTVAIFNEALSHGPDIASFLSELQNEAREEYMLPMSVKISIRYQTARAMVFSRSCSVLANLRFPQSCRSMFFCVYWYR
jgi:hypothetical protein